MEERVDALRCGTRMLSTERTLPANPMNCAHPFCPMNAGAASWPAVLAMPDVRASTQQVAALLTFLPLCGPLAPGSPAIAIPPIPRLRAVLNRPLTVAPCLYAQIHEKVTARAVVHLCELSLRRRITSTTVYRAFRVQYPNKYPAYSYAFPPKQAGASGGDIMEALCSEVLTNEGIPHMATAANGWPVWQSVAHVSLNLGKYRALKLHGDLLIPSAPHNFLISVKSEAARERFVLSGNRLDSIGFGFFSDATEFGTVDRIRLLKRWGFVAIYLPGSTLRRLKRLLSQRPESAAAASNVNGKPLFRNMRLFGQDMRDVAGKHTFLL